MDSKFAKAGLLTIALVIGFIACWEFYLRSKGEKISFDDGNELWSHKRSEVYLPSDKATVFIGSSRIKFDLDIPTWEAITGEKAVQLAIEGSSPLPILFNLADDPNYKGKTIIDVTEGLFFSSAYPNIKAPNEGIEYYKKITPSQKLSFHVNKALESKFVFLDKEYFTINRYLQELQLKDRPGVFEGPYFPNEFGRVTFDRQTFMTEEFVADTNLQNQVKGVWAYLGKLSTEPPLDGKPLEEVLEKVAIAVDKIRKRGGQVIFVRTPSSGPFWMGEKKVFPREKYWENILKTSNSAGIHFEDYESIAHFICPEFSHLSPKDAIVFTRAFIPILEEKGWKFPKKNQNLLAAK